MATTKKMILLSATAMGFVLVAVLAFPQGRHYLTYNVTNEEGVRGEKIDQPYINPAVAGQNDVGNFTPTVPEPASSDEVPAPVGEDQQATNLDLDAPLRIAVAGDVGTGGEAEYATAASMDRIEGEVDYAALLLLGDNVYPDGDPADVQRKILDPFGPVLDGGTRLLPVLGNHDNDDGYGDEQVAALGMPGRWYSTEIGNTLIVSLDSNRADDPDQLRWLDATLASNDATWTIVQFHHPPYSGGWHGSDDATRDAFVPLLEEYGVDLVLSGHDHDYQRTKVINGITYIVSGAAANVRDANLADFSEVALSTHHFVDLTITSDRIEVRAVDHNDRIFDEATVLAT